LDRIVHGLREWCLQGIRYGIVGVGSNVLLYFLYLGLTSFGIDYKIAMTCMFLLGVLGTFFFNSRWTFSVRDCRVRSAFLKYVLAYGGAYACNLLAMFYFVDELALPHQIVQAAMIVVLAGFLFLLQKHWVFGSFSSSSIECNH